MGWGQWVAWQRKALELDGCSDRFLMFFAFWFMYGGLVL